MVFRGTLALLTLLALTGIGTAGELDPKLNPSAAPGATMKSLDQVLSSWDQVLPAAGRLKLVMGGEAVLDRETGLVWQRVLSDWGISWEQAVNYCLRARIGGRYGWRLATLQELFTLVATEYPPGTPGLSGPDPLPAGHPFDYGGWLLLLYTNDVKPTSPTHYGIVNLNTGVIQYYSQSTVFTNLRPWCVRAPR